MEAGSYLRLMDSRITQLKAQGPSRTFNESKEEEEGEAEGADPSREPNVVPNVVKRQATYRVISRIRNRLLLGPYSSPVPRGLGWSSGGARFLMGEVPMYSPPY